ncbi:MAG: response regulator [Sphingomonadales bacterium]|nr:response regulator [Sphingomonadales bacterium]
MAHGDTVDVPETVFIADPNTQLCSVIRGLMMKLGALETVTAANSERAKAHLQESLPDLIVCGYGLPPDGGPNFVRYLRRMAGPVSETPIIMVIANPNAKMVGQARDAGVDEVLGLPLNGDGLAKRWHNIVHKRRPFVRCEVYVGPCRRRITAEWYVGPDRRQGADSRGGARRARQKVDA